jgi:hypothetical protein
MLKSSYLPWLIEKNNLYKSFLPSIRNAHHNEDGYRPYRRNDFSNNHVFTAKQKLAHVLLERPTIDSRASEGVGHRFNQPKPKQRNFNAFVNKAKVDNAFHMFILFNMQLLDKSFKYDHEATIESTESTIRYQSDDETIIGLVVQS